MESLGKFPDPFLAEIAGQPDAIRRAARGVADQVDDLAHVPSISRPTGSALFTGMGASYAASLAPVTVLAESGIRASRVDAAELLHFRLGTIGGGAGLLLVRHLR